MLKKLALVCVLQSLLLAPAVHADEGKQTLMDIYNLAVASDPKLASAASENKAAQESIVQAKAAYKPNVNFNASASATNSNVKVLGSSVPFGGGNNNFETINYGVEARQAIFRKDSLVAIDQSKILVNQSNKQYAQAKQDLMLRTTQAYFDVLTAQDKIGLIQAQKKAILGQLDQAKATFEVGSATITDVNEAQARYDLAIAQEIAAANEFHIALRALEALTGTLPSGIASVQPNLTAETLQESLQEWQTVAEKNNLNILILQDTYEIAQKEVNRASAGHLPTLDAVASYRDNRANGGPNNFGNDSKTANIGVELNLPIYLGGAVSSRVRQAEFNRQKSLDNLQDAKRQTRLETQRAYLNLKSTIAQVKALEQALKSSLSQLDSTQLGYEVGVRTSVDVLDAQQQLYSAKRDLLEARYSYLVSIIQLKSAAGVVNANDLQKVNQYLVSTR